MVSSQSYQGTHRHRPPLGWHPQRTAPETRATGGDGHFDESTEPFTPTFTGELPAPPVLNEEAQPVSVPEQPDLAGGHQYLKRWMFVLVVAGVWIVSAAAGVGLYYWWFQSLDKTAPVFVVLVYVVVCTVGSLLAAMAQNKPLVSALSIGLMSAPLAAVGGAAVLHGLYFCEHASRCLMGLIPY